MMFSVLMSVYCKEDPLALDNSINSVLKSTIIPDEFVIVKDGPLPKTLESIINSYQTRYPNIIKIIENKRNLGLGKSLAKGLLECRNEIVARMDSDDICRNDRFNKQLEILDKNPDIAIVGSNISEYNEDMSKKIGKRTTPQYDQEIREYSKKRNPFNHMTVMFRKTAIIDAGNYMDMSYFEDYYLWLRLIRKNKGYNIQEELVHARTGIDMIKRRGGLKYVRSIIKFEKTIKKEGFINGKTMLFNICSRLFAAMIPFSVRSLLYKKYLHKKTME